MANLKEVRRGNMTVTGVVIILVVVFVIINGFFYFMIDQGASYGTEIDPKYNKSFNQIIDEQANLDSKVSQIRDDVSGIEAESGVQFLWNSFKGLGTILLLPIDFISYSVQTATALILPVDFLPTWVQTLVILVIVAGLAFLVIAVLTGGNPKI